MYDGIGRLWRRPDHQEAWLFADLAATDPDRPIVLMLHFPLDRNFYHRLRSYPIVATLSGHWHSSRVFQDGATVHYNTPSLSKSDVDESPRGYRVCMVRNNTIATKLQTLQAINKRVHFLGIGAMPHPQNELGKVKTYASCTLPTPADDWPLYGGNPQRTSEARSGPQPPLQPVWRAGTGGGMLMASPIVAEGKVFVGTKREDQPAGSAFLALDAKNGVLLWERSVNAAVKLAPAYEDGRLFGVTVTGEVLAMDAADGSIIWSYQLGDPSQRWVYMSPLVHQGRVFVGMNPHFVALDAATGNTLWVREDQEANDWYGSYPSPAIYGPYLILSFRGQALNLAVWEADTGRTVWISEGDRSLRINSTPVVGADGIIYAVYGNSHVRAINITTQTVAWENQLDQVRTASAPALADGMLFVPTGAGTLYALIAKEGKVVWNWTETVVPAFSSCWSGRAAVAPPVMLNNTLYFGSVNGWLYALNSTTGNELWRYNLGAPTLSAPAVSGNGLWTCSCAGYVYAFSNR
jgi:outer membrane protein assembly factor BamB